MKYGPIVVICLVVLGVSFYVLNRSDKTVMVSDRASQNSAESVPVIPTSSYTPPPSQQAAPAAYADARQKGNEAGLKASMLSFRPEFENLAGGYQSVCKDGVINTSTTQVKPNVNRILEIEGVADQKSAGISCVSSASSYAVSIHVEPPVVFQKLSYCIDSSGFAGNGKLNSSRTACE